MSASIRDILTALEGHVGPGIAVDGVLGSDTSLALEAERATTTAMVEKRALEFLTGRTCARRAMRAFEVTDAPLLPGSNRAPIWPSHIVGSISHTTGACIAAVGKSADFFAIGVDIERADAVSAKLEKFVATAGESERLAAIVDWRTIVFSTKESVFKALNPPTGIWLEFKDVDLVHVTQDTFEARVTPRDHDPFTVNGRYARFDNYVVSSLVVARDAPLGLQLQNESNEQ